MVNLIASRPRIAVSADRTGLVSHAGGLLSLQTPRVTGVETSGGMIETERVLLTGDFGPSFTQRSRPLHDFTQKIHDPGKVITDLALTLALGGDCLADIAMLRAQPEVFGPVASDPTVPRLALHDTNGKIKSIRHINLTA